MLTNRTENTVLRALIRGRKISRVRHTIGGVVVSEIHEKIFAGIKISVVMNPTRFVR